MRGYLVGGTQSARQVGELERGVPTRAAPAGWEREAMTANEVAPPRRRTCPLCEAMCGLTLEVSGERVLAVRGDPEDAFSGGISAPRRSG
jgi:anaerobic selenocysteine-containing dehydrogenase